jgi:transposase
VFLDESGFMLTPLVRRTLAPCGQTPILDCLDRRDRISVISAISVSPIRADVRLWFRILAPNTNVRAKHIVDFLRQLGRSLTGGMTVLWDRSQIHGQSLLVKSYLAEHPEVVAEDFPGYAPSLNPAEGVWGWSKYSQLANWAPSDADALWDGVFSELYDLREQPQLLTSFIHHAGLPFRL